MSIFQKKVYTKNFPNIEVYVSSLFIFAQPWTLSTKLLIVCVNLFGRLYVSHLVKLVYFRRLK